MGKVCPPELPSRGHSLTSSETDTFEPKSQRLDGKTSGKAVMLKAAEVALCSLHHQRSGDLAQVSYGLFS